MTVDDKTHVNQMMEKVFERGENIVGKAENAGNQHFLLFPQCFPKPYFLKVIKSQICLVKGNSFQHYFSAPIHASLELISPELHKIFYPCHWLLFHLTIIEKIDNSGTEMNSEMKTIINLWNKIAEPMD